MSEQVIMSPIIEYIQTLPVSGGTKWFCAMLAYAKKRVFTQQWLIKHTSYERRTVRHFLYNLIDCGVISRQKGEDGRMHYVISDTRLIHHIAAEKNGFTPINYTNNQ